MSVMTAEASGTPTRSKYDRLIAAAQKVPAAPEPTEICREPYYLLSSTSFEGCSGVKIDLTQDCRDGHSHIKWIGIQ
jgi:hypothetical protein